MTPLNEAALKNAGRAISPIPNRNCKAVAHLAIQAYLAALPMGDASTRKDEAVTDAGPTSPATPPSEISVVDESDLKDIIDNALVQAMDTDGGSVEAVFDAISPYLATREPVLADATDIGDDRGVYFNTEKLKNWLGAAGVKYVD